MAHYALLDENNIVISVITGVDENIVQTDLDGKLVGGSQEAWEEYYGNLPWFNAKSCKRTSYNNKIRKQYAGIGYSYNPTADVFIAPKPFPSWSLDENYDWQAPISRPEGLNWYWDEELGDWVDG